MHSPDQLSVCWHTQGLHAYAHIKTKRHDALPVSKPIQMGSRAVPMQS